LGALPAEWTQAGNRSQRRRVNMRSFAAHGLRAFNERSRHREVVLVPKQAGEIVADRCRAKMLRADQVSTDRTA
jgi:hypothetical protein